MKIYIDGVLATNERLHELEQELRAGIKRAYGRCCQGFIYLKTV